MRCPAIFVSTQLLKLFLSRGEAIQETRSIIVCDKVFISFDSFHRCQSHIPFRNDTLNSLQADPTSTRYSSDTCHCAYTRAPVSGTSKTCMKQNSREWIFSKICWDTAVINTKWGRKRYHMYYKQYGSAKPYWNIAADGMIFAPTWLTVTITKI